MVLDQINQMFGSQRPIAFLLIALTIVLIIILTSRRGGGFERYYYRAKRMRRKRIEKHISNLEKRILKLDRMISVLKTREHGMEIRFAAQRDDKFRKELENIRKRLTALADKRDRLLEEKQAYAKAYREVTL